MCGFDWKQWSFLESSTLQVRQSYFFAAGLKNKFLKLLWSNYVTHCGLCKWVDIQLKYGEIVWPLYVLTLRTLSRKRSLYTSTLFGLAGIPLILLSVIIQMLMNSGKSFFWNEVVVPPHDYKDVFLLKSDTFYRAGKFLGNVYMNGNKDVTTFVVSIFSLYNEQEQITFHLHLLHSFRQNPNRNENS